MILCNLCGKHQATLYFKGLINDQPIKLHLCGACAKKRGMAVPSSDASVLSLGELLARLAAAPGHPLLTVDACARCGLSYEEFERTSQLGCGACYEVFAPLLGPLFERLQGRRRHAGKAPVSHVPGASLRALARLKLELQEAVHAEAYETAAGLRDEIAVLEERLKRRTGPEGRP
jgi:protein arginine kinase activator